MADSQYLLQMAHVGADIGVGVDADATGQSENDWQLECGKG